MEYIFILSANKGGGDTDEPYLVLSGQFQKQFLSEERGQKEWGLWGSSEILPDLQHDMYIRLILNLK